MKGFPESRDARFTGLSAALAVTVWCDCCGGPLFARSLRPLL